MPDLQLIDPLSGRLKRMRKNVLNSCRLHKADMSSGGFRYRCAMITLTYKHVDAYDPRDISLCIKSIRRYMQTRGIPFRYVWVMELQKRSAPHYHLITWLPYPRGSRRGKAMKLPKPDKCGWWTKGSSRIEWIRKPMYIAKYASKMQEQGKNLTPGWKFPQGARISGQGGLSDAAKLDRRWWCCPSWVRKLTNIHDDMRPVPGGYASKVTGDFLKTPYRVHFLGGQVFIELVGPPPDPITFTDFRKLAIPF